MLGEWVEDNEGNYEKKCWFFYCIKISDKCECWVFLYKKAWVVVGLSVL